jgi:hypothetical protein
LVLEPLEDRAVPAILFGNSFGRVPEDLGGPVINTAHVELVFWGNGWNSGVGPALRGQVQDAVDSIVSGPYLTLLAQYRSSIRSGTRVGSVTVTSSAPPNPFSDAAVVSFLQVNINNGVTVTLNGETAQFPAGAIAAVVINTGTGNDTVVIERTGPPVKVNLGNGTDTVDIAPGTQNLNNIPGNVTVTGLTAADTLTVNDQANATVRRYTLTATTFTRAGGGVITYNPAPGNLVINGGGGADTYQITGTAGATATLLNAGNGGNSVRVQGSAGPLTINTGAGDTVTLAGGFNTLDPIGAVAVNDPTGTSAVVVVDSGFGPAEDYLVSSTGVTVGRSGSFVLTYRGIASLTLDGGRGGDTFDLDSTSAITAVNGGAGFNRFRVSPLTQYLAGSLAGPLALTGSGSDVLDFFDANDPNAEIVRFDSVPSSLTLGSTGATVATFTVMGSVYVVTNGFSTPDDQSGTVVFDPDGGPPCVWAGGPGPAAAPAGIPASPLPGALLPPPPNPVETRWTRGALLARPTTAAPLDPVAALDLVFTDLRY